MTIKPCIAYIFFVLVFCIRSIAQNNVEIIPQEGHIGNITALQFSNNGYYLATGSNEVKIWDLKLNKLKESFIDDVGFITSIDFSPDDQAIMATNNSMEVVIWNITSKEKVLEIRNKNKNIVRAGFYKTNNQAYFILKNGNIEIFDIINKEVINVIEGGKNNQNVLDIHNNKLITCKSNSLKLYNLESMQEIGSLKKAHNIEILGVFFIDDNNLISIGKDNLIKYWNIPAFSLKNEISTTLDKSCYVCYNKNTQLVAVIDLSGQVKVFDVNEAKCISSFNSTLETEIKENRKIIAFNKSGNIIAASGFKKTLFSGIKTDKNFIELWDVNSKIKFKEIGGSVYPVDDLTFIPNTGNLISLNNDMISIWSLEEAKLLKNIHLNTAQPKKSEKIFDNIFFMWEPPKNTSDIYPTSNGDHIVFINPVNNELYKVNTKTNNVSQLYPGLNSIHCLSVSAANSYIAVGGDHPELPVSIISSKTNKVLHKLKLPADTEDPNTMLPGLIINSICISPDGKYVAAVVKNNGAVIIWSTYTWDIVFKDVPPKSERLYSKGFIQFTKSGKSLYASRKNMILKYTRSGSGNWSFNTSYENTNGNPLLINDMSEMFYSKDNEIHKTDLNTKEQEIIGNGNRLTSYGEIYAIGDRKGRITIYHKQDNTYQKNITLIHNNDDYIFITPENYYYINKNGFDLIAFKYDDKLFPFEQFDLIYNRPDKVFEKLNPKDTIKITLLHYAYEKRLQKLGIKEENLNNDFHIPESKIKNFEYLPTIIDENEIEIDLNFNDSKYKLDRINVWINNVAVYGIDGIDLRQLDTKNLDKKIKLELASGKNKIQFSCLNQKGVESYKETVEITYEPKQRTKPDLFIVAISVSEYQQSEFNLQYAVKDGRDIANLYSENSNKIYDNIYVDTLFNNNATIENVAKVKEKLLSSKVDDQVILYVSGHGLLDDNLDFYFASHDMDFNDPAKHGISYDMLEGLLDSIPARKKLFLMDACHSGEVDKDVVAGKEDQKLSEKDITANSFKKGITLFDSPKLGLQNTFELMQELFVNLNRGSGAQVISAAAGNSYALESDEWQNGVFTYSILSGLKDYAADISNDKQITVSELKSYVSDKVVELTNGAQKPTSRQENVEFDFRVW